MLFQLNGTSANSQSNCFWNTADPSFTWTSPPERIFIGMKCQGVAGDTDIRIIQLVNIWSDFFIRSWWTSCRHIYLTWHYRKHSLSLFLRLMTPFDNGKYSTMFKVPRRSNCRYPFFTFSYTISLSERSCQISIYYEHWNSRSLDLYFREFTAAINFSCSSLNRQLIS